MIGYDLMLIFEKDEYLQNIFDHKFYASSLLQMILYFRNNITKEGIKIFGYNKM